MNWLKKQLSKIKDYFFSGKAQRDATWVLEHMTQALPYIDAVMPVVTGLIPGPADDAIWQAIRTKYPHFFDGTVKSPDELKAAAMIAAAELFAERYKVDTTLARSTVQMAFIQHRAQ